MRVVFGFLLVLALPGAAWAGMPTVTLTDIARMRLQNISFFLAGFLLAALFIKLVWNGLQKDWTFLPRLSYGKAVGLVALWGMLFLLVLTMISGARELMTPGAWEKQGVTYRLAKDSVKADEELAQKRRRNMDKLREALWDYARAHDGQFSHDRDNPAIPWNLPETGGMRYLYLGGKISQTDGKPLAFEPEIYSGDRFVLFTNGDVRRLDGEQLQKALAGEKK